ncbi:MAG: PilN domain-containing protein [Myxococcota bacterium]|nr:PilN domain-containing protein [Myxococcota bacterium]
MIRVNLLRVRAVRERRKASSAAQVGVFVAVVAVELAVVFYFHRGISREIDDVKAQAAEINSLLADQRSKMADFDRKRAELETIHKKRDVIAELEAGRTGPKTMIHELIRILSKGVGPTIGEQMQRELRQQNLGVGFNRAWDWRKLWIDKFTESDRTVTIEGKAMDIEDISEFQRRLNLSQYFEDVRWMRSPEERQTATGGTLYQFEIKGRVLYQ